MGGPTGVDWLPPLAVLAVGILVGTVLVLRLRAASRLAPAAAAAGPAVAPPVELRDLEGHRDTLLRQLRELEDTAAKRTPEQLAVERYALELEAARILLHLDERGAALEKKTARAAAEPVKKGSKAADSPAAPGKAVSPEVLARRLAMRGFLRGAGTVAVLGVVAFLVVESAKPRDPAGSVTGDTGRGGFPGTPSEGQASRGAEEAQIKERLLRNPDDFDARIALSRVYLGRQDMMGVWNETKYVLERSPGEPRALSYQALVRVAMGQPELALDMLKKAIAAAPDLLDAYMHLALVYVRLGRDKEAAATIDEAARRFPQEGASLKQRFQEMKTAAAEAPAPTEGDPHAGIAPPSEGAGGRPSAGGRPGADPAGPGATAGSAGGKRVSGVVELDPALEGSVAPEAFLFVFVRESGFGAGPPVAVRRFASPSFPVRFEISDADAMMGQTFPNELLVEARLDADGDPTTRPPTDPKARLDDVRVGRSDVRLVLKR